MSAAVIEPEGRVSEIQIEGLVSESIVVLGLYSENAPGPLN